MKLEEEIKSNNFQNENQKAILNILFTSSWIKSNISCVLKQKGIYHEQYNVLRILRGAGDALNQKEILSRMLDKNSNLTRIISKLSLKNLIEVQKSETDKREYLIAISHKGLDLLAEIDPEISNLNIINNLTETESLILNELLNKLRS